MPLLPGKANIGSNIKEMMKAGHPYNVARAASLRKAYGAPTGVRKPRSPISPMKPLTSLRIKMGFKKIGKLK